MPATSVRDIIDTTSARYARAWELVQKALVRIVDKKLAAGVSPDELMRTLGNTDFSALIGRDLGMNAELAEIQAAYGSVLKNMVGRQQVTESTLTALRSFTEDSFLAKASAVPAQLKEEVMKALLGGGRTSDVEAALSKVMAKHNAAAEANTALNTFSRSVGYEMAKQDPEDALYVYEGPVDDVTRDECLAMAAAGELTRAEIESQFPGAFVGGGGFNCRHEWTPKDAALNTDQDGAKERLGQDE